MRKVSTLVGLTLFALAGMARAQDEAPAAEEAAAPAAEEAAAPAAAPEESMAPAPEAAPVVASGSDYVSRGLTLSAGNLQVTVPIVLNLSKEAVLKPVYVPLDVRYGVTDQVEVFLVHASGTPAGFPVAAPGGVCLGGTERNCTKLYDNLAVGGQFSLLKDAGLELAAMAAFEVLSLDGSTYGADVGVNFKYATGPIAIKAAPVVQIGVNKRDAGNIKQNIILPVQIAFQAVPDQLAIFLDTGIKGPTEKFGDSYMVPVGVGASFQALPNLDVGGEFLLPMVAKGSLYEGIGAADMRYLGVFAQYRLQ